MLFVTGLLTLLALANAEGDHIKGGVKGHPLSSASKQVQQITQEEPIPSPYNFAIKSAASYGTKIVREESGDAEGRVKGSYTIDGPRGTSRVVQYQADDSGFHATVKTSEPNIKTHSPSNAVIEAVPKDSTPLGQSSQQIQGKIHHAAALHHASVEQSPVSEGDSSKGVKTIVPEGSVAGKTTLIKLREPTARPVKTIDSQGSSPAQVKGASATKSFTVAQQQRGSLLYTPAAKDSDESQQGQSGLDNRIRELNRGLIQKQGEAGFLQTFTGGVDGVSFTSADLEGLSKQIGLGLAEEPKRPEPIRPVVRTSPQQVPGSRRRVVPAPVLLREPVAVPVLRAPVPAPVAPSPQVALGDDIIAINRGLIQRQGESGITQTFGGIVGTDGSLSGVTITDSELENLSKQIGFGARAQALPEPEKPKPVRPSVVRTSPQQVPVARRPVQVIPGVSRVSGTTFTSTQGENIRFTLGQDGGIVRPVVPAVPVPAPVPVLRIPSPVVRPAVPAPVLREPVAVPVLRAPVPAPIAPSPQVALEEDIIAINRGLIQRQGVAGITQTFGGIVGTDGSLSGVTITDSELENLSKQIGFGSRAQALPEPEKPKPARPSVVRNSPQQVPVARRPVQVIPGVSRVSGTTFTSTQGENIRFTLGQDAGIVRPVVPVAPVPAPVPILRVPSPVPVPRAPAVRVSPVPVAGSPQGDGIIAINRGLIQKQGEAGFTQTFGGIVGTDGNLAGVSITAAELEDLSKQIGFGSRGQVAPGPETPKPATRPTPARTSAQYVPGQVIPGISRVSGTRFTSTQGENIQFTLGSNAGQVKPVSPAAPSPALRKPAAVPASAPRASLPDNIIAINRQLIQTQGVSGVSQTFGGIVGTDGNVAGVSITDSQLQDLSKQIGFGTGPQTAPEPAKPRPVRPVVRTSPQQVPVSRNQIVQGVSRVSGTTFSSTQGENIRFTLGNDAGVIAPVKPVSPVVPSPALRRPAPVQTPVYAPGAPSPDNIIALNRELIQKQGVTGLSQAFGGIIRTDGNLDGVSLTTSDLENLSQQIGFGSRLQTTPERPQPVRPAVLRTPQQVPGSRPAAPKPRVSGVPVSTTQGENIRFTLGADAVSSGLAKPASPAVRAPTPAVRAPIPVARAPTPAVRAPTPAVRAPSSSLGPQAPSSDNIIALNRGLIQKQGEAGLSQVFGGGDLSALSLTAAELEDLSKQIGFASSGQDQASPEPKRPEPVRPAPARTSPQQPTRSRYSAGRQPVAVRSRGPQAFSQASRGRPGQDNQKQINQDQIEAQVVQETFDPKFPTASALKDIRQDEQKQTNFVPDFVVVDSPSDQQDNQLRVKLDDISDPSIQSQVLLGDFSEKYQQEKLPVEVPGYVPSPSFMAPFNYRVPGLRSLNRPLVQEQEKVEQVFV